MKNKLFIGVVGPIAAGKGELARYLMGTGGFTAFSLSSVVHQDLRSRGVTVFERKDLQDTGDELRKRFSNDVLARRAIDEVNHNGISKVVIEGIRNVAEVKFLQSLPYFILIAVTAKKKVRFDRLMKRSKPWDPVTWQQFLKTNRRDLGLGEKSSSGQQVRKCMEMAQYHIANNRDLSTFYQKIESLMQKILRKRT